MYKTSRLLLAFFWLFSGSLRGQTVQDSLAIAAAQWQVLSSCDGMTVRQMMFPRLYGVPQTVSIAEIRLKGENKVGISVIERGTTVSGMADNVGALVAVNGSYFNMERGNSVCYLKINGQVVNTTETQELASRVTGAIHADGKRLRIMPWNRQTELTDRHRRGTLLASGPLLLMAGRPCDLTGCDSGFVATRHPRTAIATVGNDKLLFITVDGRATARAVGMNLIELAHFLRVIGCRDAINMDGGGSTTLWVKSLGGVVNHPCDNRQFDHQGERKVANIIYVYKQPTR
ncbi:phosphodiester glycosidase family protein [Prevotella sp. A2931]|uniref:Phosphodiester glycosidase family protein n=2 Tax=Prevotellaceae TaxID=171552 RepID=A0ABS3M7X7_9BACT|nr:phosphodiester glycosidase family protein [Prevotella illustrans]PTL26738.1 hypothetical protein C3V39_06610 [Prevotella sp. oral taxon 820]